MLQIDERIDAQRIREWASNAQYIKPNIRRVFDEMILKDEGREFYFGQLAALQYAHQLNGQIQENQGFLACALAIIAEHIVQKGWEENDSQG